MKLGSPKSGITRHRPHRDFFNCDDLDGRQGLHRVLPLLPPCNNLQDTHDQRGYLTPFVVIRRQLAE